MINGNACHSLGKVSLARGVATCFFLKTDYSRVSQNPRAQRVSRRAHIAKSTHGHPVAINLICKEKRKKTQKLGEEHLRGRHDSDLYPRYIHSLILANTERIMDRQQRLQIPTLDTILELCCSSTMASTLVSFPMFLNPNHD